MVHHLNQALKANKMFKRDIDYIVKDGKIVIIDEFTGRMMDGRRWSDGLHQAVEAKEGVQIEPENQTLASITFQNYFRMYPEAVRHDRHGGDRGARILRHLQDERRLDPDQRRRSSGSTRTTNSTRTSPTSSAPSPRRSGRARKRASRSWSAPCRSKSRRCCREFLNKEGIQHSVLNARFHESEAHIVAQAGRLGAVTIATNMAGRGTDIQLGGNLEFRIEDELKDVPEGPERDAAIERIAAEIEAEKQQVLDAGGLFVLGTERHESRRIDNQLRGRSGRQGDPGLSRFYLSLDDDLLRIFGPQTAVRAADEQEPRGWRGDRHPRGSPRRSRPRRRRSRRATTTSASRSSNSTT